MSEMHDYSSAARSIALNLSEFCDRSKYYPEMISDAARKAKFEIDFLRHELKCAKGTVEKIEKALEG
jgi:hypothetical protein